MKPKMSIAGVGPKIALSTLPYLAAVVAAMLTWPNSLRMECSKEVGYAVAAVLGALFLLLYGASVRALLTKFPKGVLITSGPYALSRNPLYASAVLFGLPALAFALRSWLLLSGALVAWLACAVFVRQEEAASRTGHWKCSSSATSAAFRRLGSERPPFTSRTPSDCSALP